MKQRIGSVFALSAGILWGIMGIFVRHFSSLGLDSLEIGEIRIGFGFFAILLYLVCFHRKLLKIQLKDLWCFAGAGIASVLLVCFTYFKAMQYTSLAVASVLLYTAPIFVMLFSAVLFKEAITRKKVLALVLAFLGCVFVSGMGSEHQISVTGLLLGLGAGISYSMYSIFSRYAIRRGYGAWTITFYAFLFCILAGAFLCDWSAIGQVMAQPVNLAWGLGLGVCTAFAPYVLYSLSLERLESSLASILASVEPVVATLSGFFLFHEALPGSGILGILLTLTAVVLLSLPFGESK